MNRRRFVRAVGAAGVAGAFGPFGVAPAFAGQIPPSWASAGGLGQVTHHDRSNSQA